MLSHNYLKEIYFSHGPCIQYSNACFPATSRVESAVIIYFTLFVNTNISMRVISLVVVAADTTLDLNRDDA